MCVFGDTVGAGSPNSHVVTRLIRSAIAPSIRSTTIGVSVNRHIGYTGTWSRKILNGQTGCNLGVIQIKIVRINVKMHGRVKVSSS